MDLDERIRNLLNLLKFSILAAFLAFAQSTAQAEPVFNLPDTDYEEESREAAISLIRSIQLIYEALLFLEQNEFSGADEALSESRSEAETALRIYLEIEDSVEEEGAGGREVRDLQAVLQESPETFGRYMSFANAIGISTVETLSEVVEIAVQELRFYVEELGEVGFEGPPFFDAVNSVQTAINRVVFVGTIIPRLTSGE